MDSEENKEDEYVSEERDSELVSEGEERVHMVGPDGAIYASSSSGEELTENERGEMVPKKLYLPHKFHHAFG